MLLVTATMEFSYDQRISSLKNFCWGKTELSLEKKSQAINSQDKIMLASVQLYVFPMTKNPFNVNLRDSPLTSEM